MQSLIERKDVDYRLIFLLEEHIVRRIRDFYFSRRSHGLAPFFEEIMFDMCDLVVLLFVEYMKDEGRTNELDAVQYDTIEHIRKSGDPDLALEFIRVHTPSNFLDLFQRDMYLFLLNNQLNFFMKPLNRYEATCRESRLLNPAIVQVW